MNYDIFSHTAPSMPNLGKGTEIVKLLLSPGIKRHVLASRSDAFPLILRTQLRHKISTP